MDLQNSFAHLVILGLLKPCLWVKFFSFSEDVIVFCCFEVFPLRGRLLSGYCCWFILISVFPVEILVRCPMNLGLSLKSGGLRSGSKGLSLWLGLLGMDLQFVTLLGHLMGEPQRQDPHVMGLINNSSFIYLFNEFNEHLILCQALF